MTYTLHQLAAGSYDLALDGVIVGDVVRDVTPGGQVKGWRAELLDDVPVEQIPRPFSAIEHQFHSLEAVAEWLGGAPISTAFEDA
ncbi:hypothetical protein AFCDBAGC_0689 [Methylobacterium cerastii]|uniref:Uncharacterized protein n=1 Tax=Methylobacterium cerastii TaxID=932741 RepID=A0ABQ4QD59_9HYPH|nr:hypothetical protein [Methylobacterium cerastii]GJD42847.1 hypothetical protein AFCDBAGC_0689 [Methylobacterium cerastii]